MAETLEIEDNARGFDSLGDAFFRSPPFDQRYKKVNTIILSRNLFIHA